MALTERTLIGSIEVVTGGVLQVRRDIHIVDDATGAVVSTRFQRVSYPPGADVTAEDPLVQAQAAAAWTPAIIDQYEATIPEPSPAMPSTVVDLRDFMRLFTRTERIAFRDAAAANKDFQDAYELLTAGPTVDRAHPDVAEVLTQMAGAALGGFSAARAAQVIAGTAPPTK